MENEIMNVAENTEVVAEVAKTKKLDGGTVAVLGFAGVGVLATGYGLYKLVKWGIGKIKDKKAEKAAQELTEAVAEAKAEEPTAE